MSFLQTSKYRNSIFTAANKNDWISFSNQSSTNLTDLVPIKASRSTIAIRDGTSNVALTGLSNKGRVEPSIINHSSTVLDLDWCNCESEGSLLAVAGDRQSSVYLIDNESKSNVVSTFGSSRIDKISFHPTAKQLVLTASGTTLTIYNFDTSATLYEWESSGKVQSVSWKAAGDMLSAISADNKLNIYDPRKSIAAAVTFESHNGVKESAVQWCGNSNHLLSAGFNSRRNREISLWDIRNTSSSVTTLMIDNGQGIMSLMYDDDSGMAFIAGRGDSKISWCEFNPTNPKLPLDTQRLPFSFSSTFIGATLVPKLALNVMEGEVNRILAITNDGSIVPVIIRVPRKSYLDFHGDIFPDTLKGIPYLSPEDWNSGKEPILERVSLDPKKSKTSETKPQTTPTSGVENPGFNGVSTPPSLQTLSVKEGDKEVKQSPASKIDLPKHSSFKHLAVTQKLLLDDLKTGPVTASNESNGFEINSKYFAFRMAGSGGRVGIYSVKATGRFATKIPTIINGVELCDFKFHPFNDNLLITGCEDGKIREFSIPENGLEDDLTSARRVFSAHSNRITLILFHTRVTDLLLTSSPENGVPAIKIWDYAKEQCLQNIAVPDMVLTVAFKNDGNLFSAITKNSEILVYNLQSGKLASKGSSHKGSKAARLMWSNDQLISVGYSSGSQREILVYKDTDVTSTIGNVIIDSSPSFLIPYLDEDTNVLILAAKGEGVMMFYEIDGSTPVFLNKAVLPLGNTVAFANLPKTSADVKGIEIIKGYRLTQTAITQLSFTVPRLRKEYFQDDIYPPTIDYTASLKISDWLQGKPVSEKRINLCPSGMTPLSKAPVETVQRAHIPTFAEVRSEEDQKQASIKAMFEMANQESKGPLVQDMLEGVADDEWFGFVAIVKYSRLWNVELVLKPVFLGGIMKGSENQPPANNPAKGAYMNKDLQRNYPLYGIEKLSFPNEFPANSLPAMRILTVIKSKSPSDLVPASLALWKQYWANGKVFNLENMVESLSPILGKDTKSIFEESTTGPIKAALQDATKEALDSGSFGAPWFVVEKDQQKQTFFGSDRLEAIACFLEEQYVGLNPDQPLNSKL